MKQLVLCLLRNGGRVLCRFERRMLGMPSRIWTSFLIFDSLVRIDMRGGFYGRSDLDAFIMFIMYLTV